MAVALVTACGSDSATVTSEAGLELDGEAGVESDRADVDSSRLDAIVIDERGTDVSLVDRYQPPFAGDALPERAAEGDNLSTSDVATETARDRDAAATNDAAESGSNPGEAGAGDAVSDTPFDAAAEDAMPPATNEGVIINEINTAGPRTDQYVELFNSSPVAVHIGGWVLDDNNPFTNNTLSFPAGTILESGGYLVVRPSDAGTTFIGNLNNTFGVSLYDGPDFNGADGSSSHHRVDAYSWALTDGGAEISRSRCFGRFETRPITPNAANDCPAL